MRLSLASSLSNLGIDLQLKKRKAYGTIDGMQSLEMPGGMKVYTLVSNFCTEKSGSLL